MCDGRVSVKEKATGPQIGYLVFFPRIAIWRATRVVAVSLLFVISVAVAQTPSSISTFASRSAACSRLLAAKRYQDAETCGLELQKAYPGRWEVYALLGRANLGIGNGGQAGVYLRLALNSAPADQANSLNALLKQAEGVGAPKELGKVGPKTNTTKPAGSAARASSGTGPSLEETLEWLSVHLPALQISASQHLTRNYDGAYTDVRNSLTKTAGSGSLKSCNVSISYSFEERGTDTMHFSDGHEGDPRVTVSSCSGQYSISLGSITESHSEGTTLSTVGTLLFQNDASKVWAVVLTGRGSAVVDRGNCTGSSSYSGFTNSNPVNNSSAAVTLYSRDQDIAERIARAFSHAAELCRGKEAF